MMKFISNVICCVSETLRQEFVKEDDPYFRIVTEHNKRAVEGSQGRLVVTFNEYKHPKYTYIQGRK